MGDLDSIPGLGRSPGKGKGYPLQYSGLENSMDYKVHGVTKSRTRLSNFHLNISLEMTRRTDSVQFSRSVVSNSLQTTRTAARQASLSISNSWSLLKLMSIESVMPSNHLIFCHPLLLLCSIFPSIRVLSNESALHIRWRKYWSFSCSISPSSEYSRLISFRIDWFDLLLVQRTLKSLLQHHSSKHQFFGTQLSLRSNSHIHTCLLEKP